MLSLRMILHTSAAVPSSISDHALCIRILYIKLQFSCGSDFMKLSELRHCPPPLFFFFFPAAVYVIDASERYQDNVPAEEQNRPWFISFEGDSMSDIY